MSKSRPYRPGPVPAGYTLQERGVPAMWIPGLAMFAASYGLMAVVGGSADEGFLLIPLVGPFLEAGQADCGNRELSGLCRFGVVLLVIDGLVQATGVGLTIAGFAIRRRRFVRNDLASLRLRPGAVGRSAYGLRLSGAF